MVASNVVWNLTVPDTSPMIQYRNFARKCPLNNGVLQCTTDSAHVSNSTESSITISFYGTAIYLFGDVDSGTKYTTALDYGAAVDGLAVKGKNLLASYANVPNSRAGGSLHQIVLSATRFTSNSLLTFTGAVISVDTGLASAKPVFSNYSITDPSVSLTPGWAKDGDYMKSGSEFSQVATFKFHGSGVMVYGMCSNTQQQFSFNNFGQVKTDTEPFGGKSIHDSSDSLIFNKRPYKTDDCLLYYNTGLPEGDHNLTYTSNKDNVFLSSFQVVSVNGSRSNASDQGGRGDALGTVGKILAIGIPAVVGIVIGVIVLLLLCCVWGCCLRRRKAAERVYLPPPAPQEDPKPATDSQPIIVLPVATYAPPPQPPPPPPTQVYVFAPDSPSEQWQPPAGRVEIPNSQLPRARSRSQRYPVASGQSQPAFSQPRRVPSQTRSEAERRSTSFENAVPYDTRVALAAAAGFPPSPAVASTPATEPGPSHDAYAGRVVLSADGMSDQRSPKARNEYAGSRSGPSASTAVHRPDEDGLLDIPPPVYEESPRPRE